MRKRTLYKRATDTWQLSGKSDRVSHFGLGLISNNGVPGNDAFTKILLHMDGSNGGTTFTDVNAGGVSNTWSALSDAVNDNGCCKFGPSSLNSGAGGFGYRLPQSQRSIRHWRFHS